MTAGLVSLLLVAAAGAGFDATAAESSGKTAAGRITPSYSRIFIPAGQKQERTLIVETAGVKSSVPLDLLLLADVSSSMQRQLDPVRTSARQILNKVKEQHNDVRFALASFSDYFPMHSSDPRDYPWRLDQDFTADIEQIRAGLDRISILHGGDGPESYARALFEAGKLAWRPGARKVVVLFGDSVAHGVDAGRDAMPGTADDLRIDEVARGLAKLGIVMVGIFEPKAPVVAEQFNTIAAITGGHAIPLRHGAEAPAAVLAGLARALRIPPKLSARPQDQAWVPHVSAPHAIDIETTEFTVALSVPEDAAAGMRRVGLLASQGDKKQTDIGEAEIEIVTGAINDPTYQFAVAFALAGLPFAFLLWRALTRQNAVHAYYFASGYRLLRITALLATITFLVLWTLVVFWAYTKLQDVGAPPLSERLTEASYRLPSMFLPHGG